MEEEECYIVLVSNHKQILQGRARLAIPFWLYEIFEIYRKFIRPTTLVEYEFAGRGTKYSTTLVTTDVKVSVTETNTVRLNSMLFN